MFSVSLYIRRFAQRLLITEKEMKRESGGIFLNLIDLSVSCRFIVEKKEKRLLRCQLSLWNSFVFVWVFFSSICSCFVHVGLHICHTLSIHIHTYANRERT